MRLEDPSFLCGRSRLDNPTTCYYYIQLLRTCLFVLSSSRISDQLDLGESLTTARLDLKGNILWLSLAIPDET